MAQPHLALLHAAAAPAAAAQGRAGQPVDLDCAAWTVLPSPQTAWGSVSPPPALCLRSLRAAAAGAAQRLALEEQLGESPQVTGQAAAQLPALASVRTV